MGVQSNLRYKHYEKQSLDQYEIDRMRVEALGHGNTANDAVSRTLEDRHQGGHRLSSTIDTRSSNTEVLSEPSTNSRPPENAEKSGPHSIQGEAFGSGQVRKELGRSATATTTTSNRSFGMRTEPCTD